MPIYSSLRYIPMYAQVISVSLVAIGDRMINIDIFIAAIKIDKSTPLTFDILQDEP